MDDHDPFRRIFAAFGLGYGAPPLSAAGRMLQHLDRAEHKVTDESHITDELRCALRRADIKASREPRQ